VGLRAGLDRQKISSTLGFDPRPSRPLSVAILTELPGPPLFNIYFDKIITEWQKEDITGIPFSKNQQQVNSLN